MPVTGTTTYTIRSLPEIHFTVSGFFLKTFDRLFVFVFVSFWSFFFFLRVFTLWKAEKKNKQKKKKKKRWNKHIILSKFFRLSRVKSVQSMCYQKIYIKVYLMHKPNHAYLIRRLRMHRNKIRSSDKIQDGGDHKFWRLTSWVSWFNTPLPPPPPPSPCNWNTWRYWLFCCYCRHGRRANSLCRIKERLLFFSISTEPPKRSLDQYICGHTHHWSHS